MRYIDRRWLLFLLIGSVGGLLYLISLNVGKAQAGYMRLGSGGGTTFTGGTVTSEIVSTVAAGANAFRTSTQGAYYCFNSNCNTRIYREAAGNKLFFIVEGATVGYFDGSSGSSAWNFAITSNIASGSNFLAATTGQRLDVGSGSLDYLDSTGTYVRTGGGFLIKAIALPTCTQALEGLHVTVAGAAAALTQDCFCTWDGTTARWVNSMTNSGGTGRGDTTTCPAT